VEAVSHLDRALSLLRSLPDASRRIEEELRLLMVLGFALLQVEGVSERLEQTFARARELIFAVGEALPKLDLSYWGLYSYNFLRARFHEAHEFAEHLVGLGERQGNRELLALGLRLMATDLFNFGDFPASLAHIQQALACSDFTLEEHRALALKHWIDPRAAVLAYASVVHSVVAQPEKARASARDAVRLADRIGHAHTRAFVLTYVALGCLLRKELGAALECVTASEALSREHRFRIWLGWSRFLKSWVRSELGEPAEALQLLDETLEGWERSGLRSGMPLYLGLRAEMLLKLGRPSEALRAIARALGWAHETSERSYLAELHRLEGLGHRALGGEARARQCFLEAMSVARQQGAITFLRRAEACLYPPHSPHPSADAS
jgi:tetratricopeptide (TPR) repeat protein